MKITKLTAENFKVLKAVSIELYASGNIIISGPNGSGKTSVLDAIALAVAGKRFAKDLVKPIREGEDAGEVTVETDTGLRITRRWTKNGTPGTLTILDMDAKRKKRSPKAFLGSATPQAFLDALIGDLSFDPLAFANGKQKDQREKLMALVDLPIDLVELDGKRALIFDERTDVNREVKRLESLRDACVVPTCDIPENEQSATELIGDFEKAASTERAHAEKGKTLDRVKGQIQDNLSVIERLKKETDEWRLTEDSLYQQIAKHVSPNLEAMRIQIDSVEETNRNVRAKKAFDKLHEDAAVSASKRAELSDKIADIDDTKKKALSEAKFPIEGLGFDEDGITYGGMPFQQCSDAERLKVSIAIAMAYNPNFRVLLVTNASLLDPSNVAIIDEMAKEHDFHVFLEVVSAGEGVGIRIEEGEVKD